MKKNIAIVGAGGFGRETACCLRAINETSSAWNLIGFFDDKVPAGTKNEYGQVLGTVEDLNAWREPLSIVLAIASPGCAQAHFRTAGQRPAGFSEYHRAGREVL